MFVEKASPYGSAVRSIIQGNTLIGNVHDCIDRLTIVCRNFTSELPNSGKFYLASKGSSFCSTFSPIDSFATDSFLESLFENLIVEPLHSLSSEPPYLFCFRLYFFLDNISECY